MGVTVKNFEVVGATDTITKFRTVVGPFGVFASWNANENQGYYYIKPLIHKGGRIGGINIVNNVNNPIDVSEVLFIERRYYNIPLHKFLQEIQFTLHMAKLTTEGNSSHLEFDSHVYGITETTDSIYLSVDSEVLYNVNTIRKTVEKEGVIYKYRFF